jgi:hypothetical protein
MKRIDKNAQCRSKTEIFTCESVKKLHFIFIHKLTKMQSPRRKVCAHTQTCHRAKTTRRVCSSSFSRFVFIKPNITSSKQQKSALRVLYVCAVIVMYMYACIQRRSPRSPVSVIKIRVWYM